MPPRLSPLVVLATVAVALSACSSAPPPTDYDVYIPEIHGAAPGSATEEPAANEWLLDFDHAGPVAIGVTFAELNQQHPGLEVDDEAGGEYCGSGYWPNAEPPLGRMSVLADSQGTRGPVDTVYVGDDRFRTVAGIGVGSTRAEVLAAYPALREAPHTYVEGGSYLDVRNDAGLAMRFLTDETGVVDLVVVGRIPQVFYIEGCL